jgi:hypothetical protein
VDLEEGEVVVSFEGREVTYDVAELDEVALAYATTVHKSQDSEYPAVVIPLATQHYPMLARNLLYTGRDAGQAAGGAHRAKPRFGHRCSGWKDEAAMDQTARVALWRSGIGRVARHQCGTMKSGVNEVEFRQEDHALLLVRVCSRDYCLAAFGLAEIVRQMRHVGWDVDVFTGLRHKMLFQPLTEPHPRRTAQNVNRGLMGSMFVCLGPRAGRHSHHL